MSSPVLTGGLGCRSFADLLRPVGAVPATPAQRRTSQQEKLREEARAEGFQQGYEEGVALGLQQAYAEAGEAGLAEVRTFASELNLVSNQIHQAMDGWYENSARELAPLAILIAERILRRELKMSRDSVVDIAREAIAEVTHSTHVRIRLNPFDSPILRDHQDLIMSIAPQLKEIEIVDDSSIQGGCVVESDGGMVVATIESKLRAIVDAAMGVDPRA